MQIFLEIGEGRVCIDCLINSASQDEKYEIKLRISTDPIGKKNALGSFWQMLRLLVAFHEDYADFFIQFLVVC